MKTQGKYKKSEIKTLKVEGRKVKLQFEEASWERINYEYMISENISKKKIYLPFMKDYIFIRNHLELKKRYLITKASE